MLLYVRAYIYYNLGRFSRVVALIRWIITEFSHLLTNPNKYRFLIYSLYIKPFAALQPKLIIL